MAKCHECTLVINQSYWFEILQTIIKSFEGWGQVKVFLLVALTLLVFSVSISSIYNVITRVHSWHFAMEYNQKIRKGINRGLIPAKGTKNPKPDFSIYTAKCLF